MQVINLIVPYHNIHTWMIVVIYPGTEFQLSNNVVNW